MMRWYNGQLLSDRQLDPKSDGVLLINDAGLKFGASVFTTLRVYGDDLEHPMTHWQAHCDRLIRSIQSFEWKMPSWVSVREGCEQLKVRYPVLRITIFPDGREWITGRSLPPNLRQKTEKGIVGWLAPATYARSLPTHKTGNYLACWLARSQAQKQGAQEAVLRNSQGDWLETATGNLWGWDGEQWWTPDDDRCLRGIMSGYLRKHLIEAGQSVSLQSWGQDRPLTFEAIAYSNCVVGLIPIHTIIHEDTRLEYNPKHERIKALQSQIEQLTQRQT